MAPVIRKKLVADGVTPVGAYGALRRDAGQGSFLLESVELGERWGRYSILGCRPRRQIVVRPKQGEDPFALLSAAMPPATENEPDIALRLAGAHVGVVCYDAVHHAFGIEPWGEAASQPVARFLGDATLVVFDNLTHTATIASTDVSEVERAEQALRAAKAPALLDPPDPDASPEDLEVDVSDDSYGQIVQRVKEYIHAGDAFQVVAARTFSSPAARADLFDVYRALRVLSPAPYMYLMELSELDDAPAIAFAGASPETLVRVEDRTVTVRPIAGTRRRGRSVQEDQALAQQMLADPKELAEHVMLIDLARNDVGRICRAGSIELPRRMTVERYSHVMHIVSEVSGELRGRVGPWDVLRATFPAGTLTGAPKVRAMQIIRELEARPRGVYGGAVGYVTRGPDLDFAIAIRTAVLSRGRFEVSAGAGIVADSVPALEAKETRNKAQAALAAVAAARHLRRG